MASSASVALDQNLFLAHWGQAPGDSGARWGQAHGDLRHTGDRPPAIWGTLGTGTGPPAIWRTRGTGTGRFGGHGGQAPGDLADTGDRHRAIWGDFGGLKGLKPKPQAIIQQSTSVEHVFA